MSRQFKLMILLNILLSLVFVALNLAYDDYGNIPGHAVQWTPLWLRFYNYALPVPDMGITIPNFTFYLFWLSTIVNLYFIIRLQRSKETS
jgi:hypothetical protein